MAENTAYPMTPLAFFNDCTMDCVYRENSRETCIDGPKVPIGLEVFVENNGNFLEDPVMQFIDYTNNNLLIWQPADFNPYQAVLAVWDLKNDTLKYSFRPPLATSGSSDIMDGIIYSSNDDGIIDRYVYACRKSNTNTTVGIIDINGNEITKDETAGLYLLRRFTECNGWVSYTTGTTISAFQKGDETPPLTLYSQTDIPNDRFIFKYNVSIPDQAHFIQFWTDASNNVYASTYTPSALGGTHGTLYDMDETSNFTWSGADYDGTYIYIIMYSQKHSTAQWVKLDTLGQVVSKTPLTGVPIYGNQDNPFNGVQYDSKINKLIYFPYLSSFYVFDISDLATYDQIYPGANCNETSKYDSNKCCVYYGDNVSSPYRGTIINRVGMMCIS